MPFPRLFTAMLVVAAFTFASHAQTGNYTCSQYTYFGPTDIPQGVYSSPGGINDSDTVVGQYEVYQNTYGFVYSRGKFTQYLVPGSKNTVMSGINDAGDIVGTDTNTVGENTAAYGFEMIPGKPLVTVNYPGSKDTYATGINNVGTIVGWYELDGASDGFILSKDGYESIAVSGAFQTEPLGINDSGEVVGTYVLFDNEAFIYQDGTYTLETGPAGATYSLFTGVNDKGEITGYYLNQAQDQLLSFVYIDGTYYNVTLPGSTNFVVLGSINNNGDITGYVTYKGGRDTAFLGTGCHY